MRRILVDHARMTRTAKRVGVNTKPPSTTPSLWPHSGSTSSSRSTDYRAWSNSTHATLGDDVRPADIIRMRKQALVSRFHAREYDGLWMKEPQEYLCDPLPRARR